LFVEGNGMEGEAARAGRRRRRVFRIVYDTLSSRNRKSLLMMMSENGRVARMDPSMSVSLVSGSAAKAARLSRGPSQQHC
jgi:hypothetical protein